MYSKTKKNAFVAMFALTFLSVPTFAQIFNTLGIGIASPQGTLHVHTSQGYNYDGPIRDGLYPYDYYRTLFRITNTITGTGSADGFVVDQIDNEVTLRRGGGGWVECGRDEQGADAESGRAHPLRNRTAKTD